MKLIRSLFLSSPVALTRAMLCVVLAERVRASAIASLGLALLMVSSETATVRAASLTFDNATVSNTAMSSDAARSATLRYAQADNVQNIYVPPPENPGSATTSPEIRAFLDVISWAETGTTDPISYQALVFQGFFSNFSTHPKIQQCKPIEGRRVCSNAAGRYQIMGFNWDELAPKLGLRDFSPESQDKMALYFIEQKGAMSDVLAGRFEQAACKVGHVWASLPCNNYRQHPKSMSLLKQVYEQRLSLYKSSAGLAPQ